MASRFHPGSRLAIHRSRGYSYTWAMFAVLAMGVYLAQVGPMWRTVSQRSREAEALREGNEIRRAIREYVQAASGLGNPYPMSLGDLVQDRRASHVRRFLRKAYDDPLTGKEWEYIRGPEGILIGVRSTAEGRPLKQGGFPNEYDGFAGAESYRDWQFVYDQSAQGR
jgi:hypothetical protein